MTAGWTHHVHVSDAKRGSVSLDVDEIYRKLCQALMSSGVFDSELSLGVSG